VRKDEKVEQTYLSFRTPDNSLVAIEIGKRIITLLADALKAIGFLIDHHGRIEADDWWFRVGKGSWYSFVVLVLLEIDPPRWTLYLEAGAGDPTASADIRKVVHPTLESVVRAISGVSRIRWHPDWTTLQDA
jgi:hypothetical protein